MATITNVGTGLVQKPLATQEWASAVSMPPKQGPVQPAPARAVPAPAPAQATKPSSTLLQRAMAGEFGTKMQQTLASKNAPQEVDATTLGTSGITVPPPASTSGSSSAVNATIAQTTPVVATEDGTTQASPRDQAIQNYMQMLTDGFDTTQDTKDLQTAAAEAKLTLDNLNTRMTEYEKETRDTEYAMRQNPNGMLAGALQADIQNYKYDRYAKKDGLADMAIAAQFALNNAEYAYEIANNAVTSEKERYTTQMQGFRDLYTMLQNDMTTSEQMQYQSQLRMYEQDRTHLMETKSLAIQRAAQNGAPADVVTAIKNATDPSQIWSVAGKYGEDPELAMKREQFGEEMKLAWSKFDWDRWATGEQMRIAQLEKNAEITKKEAEEEAKKVSAQYEAGRMLSSVNSALGNSLGFNAMTGGTSGFTSRVAGSLRRGVAGGIGGAAVGGAGGSVIGGVGAIPGAIGGGAIGLVGGAVSGYQNVKEAQTSFSNEMDFITSNLTTSRLRDLKGSGGWSGTISDADIKLIGASADRLSSMWDSQERKFKGNVDPKEAQDALARLQADLANKAVPVEENDAISNVFK